MAFDKNKKQHKDDTDVKNKPADEKKNDQENKSGNVSKHINKKQSENDTDLQVKNEVTGANLDAPPA